MFRVKSFFNTPYMSFNLEVHWRQKHHHPLWCKCLTSNDHMLQIWHLCDANFPSSDVSGRLSIQTSPFTLSTLCSSSNFSFACCHWLALFKRISKTYRNWQNQLIGHCCDLMRFNTSARQSVGVLACLFLVCLQMCSFRPAILSVTAAHNYSPTLSKLPTKLLSPYCL
jgi:hypothetical protein